MAGKEYKFYEETHTHTIGGVIVPGITTLLKPLYDFSHVPEHVLARACAYGSNVHKAVELFCYDSLDMEALDEMLVNPLAAFQKWLKDYGFSPRDFVVEVPMGDPLLNYGGIPDLILDGVGIFEIKTRKVNMLTDPLQLAAQESLWKKNGGQRIKEYPRWVIELKQDGSYVCTRVNDRQSWSRFRYLLDYFNAGRMIESWKL